MAKYDEREGNSCHIHLSLRGTDGEIVFWDDAGEGHGRRTPLYDSFVAGVLASMADFTLLFAPNINSYKRFADGSFAPTAIAWGEDNRTCAVRLVGHGARRADGEPRARAATSTPTSRSRRCWPAACTASSRSWSSRTPLVGNAYTSDKPKVPHTLRAARDAFQGSELARETLGEEVVDHYTNMADVELARVRVRRDRLGAAPRLRTDVTPLTDRPASPRPSTPS